MNNNQEQFIPAEEEDAISLSDIIRIIHKRWYWFFISIGICVGIAFLYLKWAPKIYTRTASVLIKDDSRGGGINEAAAFEEVNLFNVKRNVDNEILVFKSVRLMHETARRLHLDVSYTIKSGLRTVELYTQSPIQISFPDTKNIESFSFIATPLSDNEIILSTFSLLSESGTVELKDEKIKATPNDTIMTPVGKVVVTPTLYWDEKYLDVPVLVTKSNLENIVFKYRSELQASLASKTSTIINLTLKDESIPRAEDILNTLIAVYNEEAINDKNQITVNTSNFINERLIIIEQELGDVDANIESYKKEQQLTDIKSETGMYLQASSQYQQEQLGLENQITLAKYIRDYLTDPQKTTDLIPANTGISDSKIEGQIMEYNELLLRRNKLVGNSSSKNPVILDLNNSLNAVKQNIIRAIDNLIVGLNIQVQNVYQREVQTSRRISAVPTQQKYVLSVERQQKIKEELYLYLLNKREENELTQAITISNARIIDAATGSKIPVSPKSSLILLASFIIGCVLPLLILWLLSTLDTKVRGRKDIEDAVSIPLLGDIPLGDKKSKEEVVVKENGRDSLSEAFRIVRTNMDFMQVKSKEMQVVLFTSYNPGAGKTFVSTNLAMSFALTYKKVILVDLDIRKGTLSSHMKENGKGVTNYLSGKIETIDSIIHIGEIEGKLDVIHAGPVPPNPAELLLSDRLENMINELRKRYDYIMLDNVPAGIVADAMIVNRIADLTIYVVRAGVMERNQLPYLEKLYKENRFNNMSLILNGVNMKNDIYGSRYGYGYGYGYGK